MKPIAKILTLAAAALMACSCGSDTAPVGGGVLGDLVRPMDGRSRRATSTRADENGGRDGLLLKTMGLFGIGFDT